MQQFFLGVLWLPVDLFRLTVHSWSFFLEGYFNRFTKYSPEQPCIFCRDVDTGEAPRNMCFKIRYRNLWMVRLLQPEIRIHKDEHGHVFPMCDREGGYVKAPWYTPVLALALFVFWWGVLLYALVVTGWIPEESDPFVWLANAFG